MKKSELKLLIKSIVTEIYSSKRESLGESESLSGFEKTSDKSENTEMGLDDKKLTITTEPKEKKEGKKLPVVKKPATPKIVKEDILGMIREALEQQRVEEMVNKLGAGVPTTPTPTPPSTAVGSGSSILSPQTVAAQTPKSYFPDDTEKPNSKVKVTLDGKPIGQFDFRLPSGKISSDNMETNLYRTELPTYPLDKSVSSKYEQIENMFFDDKLPANTALNLFTAKNASGKTIMAK